jgi:predicted acetyltransferase
VSVEIRLVTPADDLEPELDLTDRAFGHPAQDRDLRLARALATAAEGRQVGAFDGTTMVASAEYHDMRQWWHGRPLPMAGVAGVKVAPEERGRGVGRALMTGLLEQIAAAGYPLSALYPATTAVYRSLGWEVAGGQYQVRVPARSLRILLPADPLAGPLAGADPDSGRGAVRRAGPGDADAMFACAAELHTETRDCGPITYGTPRLAEMLQTPGIYAYLAPDGLLVYRWNRQENEVLAYQLAAASAATLRALWSIVASHGTMVDHVRAFVGPADPVTWLVPEPDVALSRREVWMLRLVDAPAAIAGRGFPESAALAVPLTLNDHHLPANAGQWLLEISAGKAALTRTDASAVPGHPAPLHLGPRGLAALYAGTPLATLRHAGLVTGGTPSADAALDQAFTATPYMLDFF